MRWVIIIVIVLAIAATAWILTRPTRSGDRSKLDRTFSPAEQQTLDEVTITQDQLAEAVCTDGAACWVAVNGVVYDMNSSPAWKNGTHHGVHAGTDATEAFVRSNHGQEILARMPVVGRYAP